MERGDGASVMATNHPTVVFEPPVPGGFEPPNRSGSSSAGRGEALMESRMTKEMKIIQFPANIDKFTAFFDKFLKMNDEGIDTIIKYISVIYKNKLKRKMNVFSNFTG